MNSFFPKPLSISVSEPFDPDVIRFTSIADFNAYFEVHKERLEQLNAKKLNRMFIVTNPDKKDPSKFLTYKIVFREKKLTLLRTSNEKSLTQRVHDLEVVVTQLIDYVNKLQASTLRKSVPDS